VGQMLRQVWGLCGKIICTQDVLLIIRVYIIWIYLRNERTCYLIYWTALVHSTGNLTEDRSYLINHFPGLSILVPIITLKT
jgi:cation transporter-like permease